MNKTAIRKFAEWAREKLIEDIKYKAGTVGITANGIVEKLPQSTSDTYFYDVLVFSLWEAFWNSTLARPVF